MAKQGVTELGTGLDLSRTELEALRFIVKHQRTSKFRQAPSHRELVDHLNTVLPKRAHGGPAISSTVQTHRIAVKLRAKGYLVDVDEDDARAARNLVATARGERYLREHAQNDK